MTTAPSHYFSPPLHPLSNQITGALIRDLNLRRPVLKKTAAYGHFGRNDPDFTWETPKPLKY